MKGPAAVNHLDALERSGIPVTPTASGSQGQQGDDARRALTVTTVHQAKGREWDVVIAGSLSFDNPVTDPVGQEMAPYCRRPTFEPPDRIAQFDHARQHYVAFSRPKRLLVLTASKPVHPRFRDAWECLPRWDRMDRRSLGRQRFRPDDVADAEPKPGPGATAMGDPVRGALGRVGGTWSAATRGRNPRTVRSSETWRASVITTPRPRERCSTSRTAPMQCSGPWNDNHTMRRKRS